MENKLYKYELHCHTGCVSRCGRVESEEIVKLYIEKGYDGIVVTDHYSPMTFEPNWCPQRQIDFYLSGYRRMKRRLKNRAKILRFCSEWNFAITVRLTAIYLWAFRAIQLSMSQMKTAANSHLDMILISTALLLPKIVLSLHIKRKSNLNNRSK